ncbi:hypothetical protein ANANG_G00312780 [Anguilla anguilla]|uniref:C2H2-type domain-containing protein n=1 Tax=Anguilla anguilla TaxID=7936 RepID=A0A9D3RJY8_ANGAN|nr:hypothetical protein ANANG_G00312780 [Anguilla anguilla]
METDCFSDSNADTHLPLSSIRLLVPPLRLACAAMWQMTQRGEIMHYGKLEEFVTLVTETVPELLTDKQRTQLIQGLQTRLILELCRSEHLADPQTIQAHVDRIQAQVSEAESEVSDANFLELVQTLLKNPAQREQFFQEVFPVEFGPKYDATLQTLVWEFFSRLEHLLPVPDLTQTASLLSAASTGLEECGQFASHQQQLKTLLQHHKCFGQFTTNVALPSMDDCIVSSLSLPSLSRVVITSEQTDSGGQSESAHSSIAVLSSSSFSKDVVSECLIDSTDYAGVEVELRTSGAVVTHKKTGNSLVITLKCLPESQEKGNMNGPRNFSHRNGNAGWTLEANARVFACSKCLVFHSDEGYLYQHIKTAHPEEYKEFVWAGDPPPPKARLPSRPSRSRAARGATPAPVREAVQVAVGPHAARAHAHGERPFHCPRCAKRFITAWDLTRHQRTHAGKLPFYCAQCGESFGSAAELARHKQVHPDRRRYGCRQCGRSFDSLLERSQHRQTHAVRRLHKCPQCDKSYTRPSDMRRHQRSHTGERPYRCALCGKTFRSATGEKKHQQTHTGERPFPCSHCGKRFTRLPILARHERIHTGERPYLCSKCGKSFLSLGELSKHQKCHTEERPYLCAHCGKGFKREGTLLKHRRTHTGERPYRCPRCEKTFTDRSGLNRHELVHTGERPYGCAQCGKAFLSSGELLKHQRFHTGERPFGCGLCGKTFTQSCYLKRHERSHSGERPYGCPQCRKSFSCSTQLKRHARVHAEEKPFRCSECGKGFSQSCLAKAHQLTHAVGQS